jgi:hypothetical protein
VTISPSLDPSWDSAKAFIVVRGVNISVTVAVGNAVAVAAVAGGVGDGKKVKVRVVQKGQAPSVVELAQPAGASA